MRQTRTASARLLRFYLASLGNSRKDDIDSFCFWMRIRQTKMDFSARAFPRNLPFQVFAATMTPDVPQK